MMDKSKKPYQGKLENNFMCESRHNLSFFRVRFWSLHFFSFEEAMFS